MPFSFLEIGMKTPLASELAGGIACPTNATPVVREVSFQFPKKLYGIGLNLPHNKLTKSGIVFVGQAFSLSSPPSGLFSQLRVLGKPLKLTEPRPLVAVPSP